MRKDADIPERRTADGVAVKRGDMVWRVRDYGLPTRSKVTRDAIKCWTMWEMERNSYADERAALITAAVRAQSRLDAARRGMRREAHLLARIFERIPPTRTTK